MSGRFLILLDRSTPTDSEAEQARLGSAAADMGLQRACAIPGATLLADASVPLLALGSEDGIIVGTLFRRDSGTSRIGPADRGAHHAIAQDAGRTLLADYWGSYVALLRHPQRQTCLVLRDPSAAVPVYHAADGERIVLASSPDLLIDLGIVRPEIDWDFVRHALVFPRMRTARTGLVGCRELLPGTAIQEDGSTRLAWSPWPFASIERRIEDHAEAAALLRTELLRTIAAIVPRDRRLLLELSGGLDSSIVAAALAEAAIPFSCATFATNSAEGDERRYARLVAARCRAPLTELVETDRRPPLSIPVPRPRPGPTPVLRLIDDAVGHQARVEGAELLLSGGGGDNVFCYLSTAAPAVDAFRSGGLSLGKIALRDLATVTGSTIWTASRFALHKAIQRRSRPLWQRNLAFLAAPLEAVQAELHPWLDGFGRSLPGKIEHVRAIVQIFDFLDTSERAANAPMLFPLLAQPIVELCLRIPTWMWIRQGRDRAVARTAFEGLVPGAVLRRSSKGRLEGLLSRGFASIRLELKDLLVDGTLSREGLIDRQAILCHLTDGERDPDLDNRLLSIAAVELWLRSWRR